MGKTFHKVKMWNFLDEERIERGEMVPLEVEVQIDNGATAGVILSPEIASQLKLKPLGKTRVRYANMKVEEKEVVHGLVVEILGRRADSLAVIELERKVPLIGQFILEVLDLWIDSKNGRLVPNPESPDMPILEIL